MCEKILNVVPSFPSFPFIRKTRKKRELNETIVKLLFFLFFTSFDATLDFDVAVFRKRPDEAFGLDAVHVNSGLPRRHDHSQVGLGVSRGRRFEVHATPILTFIGADDAANGQNGLGAVPQAKVGPAVEDVVVGPVLGRPRPQVVAIIK